MPPNPTVNQLEQQRSEPVQLGNTSQHAPKKPKYNHSGESNEAKTIWDLLSTVWLTKAALRELDRRNLQAQSANQGVTTRRYTADSLKGYRIWQHHIDLYQKAVPKDIKHFAQHGGPDLSRCRNYPPPQPCPATTTNSTQPNRKTKMSGTPEPGSSPYDRNFHQILVENHIYPHRHRYADESMVPKPDNWDEINQILRKSRPSLSASTFGDDDFEEFLQAGDDASKERSVCELVVPFIEGKAPKRKCRAGGVPFANLKALTQCKLTPGNPNIYYGARPEQLDQAVRDEAGKYIIPTTQKDLPIAPNFFLEVKGPEGQLDVAQRQAWYYGALGARAIRWLLTYRQSALPSNDAYTISSTYQGGVLHIFTSHIKPSHTKSGEFETLFTRIGSYCINHDAEAFRSGATAYRNARDWAKQQRDMAIARANERNNAGSGSSTDSSVLSPRNLQSTPGQPNAEGPVKAGPGINAGDMVPMIIVLPQAKVKTTVY
ncbi:hypothetical protein GQ44DRAFT_750669 [Phaeosphaeriaceae sp. PMI808]|nr:hypothetical protein GQ44DRAFT_750669 [Phaeosphaeriaceae sp. PMI808]